MKKLNNKLVELEKLTGSRIRTDEPLSAHTTIKVGGPAEFYTEVDTVNDLMKIITASRKLKIPFFILGGGSNIVISDYGIKGLVIKNNCRKFSVLSMSGKIKDKKVDVDKVLVFAESGVIMNHLVRFTIDEGLKGLEYQLGMPGTVGGAIFMNSNFPKEGSFVGDNLYRAKILTETGEIKEVEKTYFNFGYDQSHIQKTREILLSVIFKLESSSKKDLWESATRALEHRNLTQPKEPSAGCIFKNITLAAALSVPTPNKITSAGYLIEKAGLKGERIGDAMVSAQHANFIVNKGNAKAEDIEKLIKLVQESVYNKFGVRLDLEVKMIGF